MLPGASLRFTVVPCHPSNRDFEAFVQAASASADDGSNDALQVGLQNFALTMEALETCQYI